MINIPADISEIIAQQICRDIDNDMLKYFLSRNYALEFFTHSIETQIRQLIQQMSHWKSDDCLIYQARVLPDSILIEKNAALSFLIDDDVFKDHVIVMMVEEGLLATIHSLLHKDHIPSFILSGSKNNKTFYLIFSIPDTQLLFLRLANKDIQDFYLKQLLSIQLIKHSQDQSISTLYNILE